MIRLLGFLFLALGWPLGSAQAIKVGVLLSYGEAQTQLAEASYQTARLYLAQARVRGGVFGLPVELLLRDDQGNVRNTLDEARDLVVNEQVHALICCSSEASVTALLDSHLADGVPTLFFHALPQDSEAYRAFSLKPDIQDVLQSTLLTLADNNQGRLALMTPSNSYGEQTKDALAALLTPGVFQLVAEQRYSPAVTVLTPEALLVATQQPDSVLVWGASRDSSIAYSGLRKRGFEGAVFLSPDTLKAQDLVSHEYLNGARFTLSPIYVQETLEPTHPSYEAATAFVRDVAASLERPLLSLEGAYLYDALHLLERAFEQALAYGPRPDDPGFRQSTRDALIGLPPFAGATGVFDFSESDHRGPEVRSLVTAELQDGRLERVTD